MMKMKTEGVKRTARIAGVSGLQKAKGIVGLETSADEPIEGAANAHSTRKPSSVWKDVNPDDIGEGFVPVSLDVFEEKAPSNRKTSDLVLIDRPFKNKFFTGKSEFVSFTYKIKLKKKNKKSVRPINEHTKLNKKAKADFAAALKENINYWTNFYLKDVLPVTLAIDSAADDLQDMLSQLVGDTVSIPVEYTKVKMLSALQILIAKKVGSKFGLTKEEINLLLPNFAPKAAK